jgi:hypothetical protein
MGSLLVYCSVRCFASVKQPLFAAASGGLESFDVLFSGADFNPFAEDASPQPTAVLHGVSCTFALGMVLHSHVIRLNSPSASYRVERSSFGCE